MSTVLKHVEPTTAEFFLPQASKSTRTRRWQSLIASASGTSISQPDHPNPSHPKPRLNSHFSPSGSAVCFYNETKRRVIPLWWHPTTRLCKRCAPSSPLLRSIDVSKTDTAACLICQQHDGRVPILGGHLIANEHVIAFHCPPMPKAPHPYLGYLFVTSRRHVPSFAELNLEEAASMGVAISKLSAALKAEGAEPVYIAGIGHGWPPLHVHLLPRWP